MTKKKDEGEMDVTDAVEIDGKKYKDGDVRRMIIDQVGKANASNREIARLLAPVYQRSLWARWGFKNFEEYCGADLGLHYRKAIYFVNIWLWYAENVTRDDVTDAVWNEIGWSKAKELVGIITDENADHWIQLARDFSFTQFAEECKRYLRLQKDGDGGSSGSTDEFKSMSFKLTADQKENVEEALKLAGGLSESEKKGHNLDLMATNFIANNADSLARDHLDFLGLIERQYGVSILAVRLSDKAVIFGREVFEAIREDCMKELRGEAKPATDQPS